MDTRFRPLELNGLRPGDQPVSWQVAVLGWRAKSEHMTHVNSITISGGPTPQKMVGWQPDQHEFLAATKPSENNQN